MYVCGVVFLLLRVMDFSYTLQVFDYYVCPETQQFKCWADDTATRTAHLASHDLQKGFPHVHWNYSAVSASYNHTINPEIHKEDISCNTVYIHCVEIYDLSFLNFYK